MKTSNRHMTKDSKQSSRQIKKL